jgi:hypothetical protein
VTAILPDATLRVVATINAGTIEAWTDSPWMRLLHELSPTIGTAIALGAAWVAWRNVKAQIEANKLNLDKQLVAAAANLDTQVAAQSVEAERNRKAQLQRELRAERRDALVNATRCVQAMQQAAVKVHWMRMAARTPELLSYDFSAEAQTVVGQQISAAESELSVHISVLIVLGLGDCAECLEQFQYALSDYVGSSPPPDVSEVAFAGRTALSRFADTLRIEGLQTEPS